MGSDSGRPREHQVRLGLAVIPALASPTGAIRNRARGAHSTDQSSARRRSTNLIVGNPAIRIQPAFSQLLITVPCSDRQERRQRGGILKFKTSDNLIDLLVGQSLYSSPDVAMRELLQNAEDACQLQLVEDPSHKPEIIVRYSLAANWVEIS